VPITEPDCEGPAATAFEIASIVTTDRLTVAATELAACVPVAVEAVRAAELTVTTFVVPVGERVAPTSPPTTAVAAIVVATSATRALLRERRFIGTSFPRPASRLENAARAMERAGRNGRIS
jgi:hypothetical protein